MTIRQLISYVGLAIFCVPVFLFVFPPRTADFTEIATSMGPTEEDRKTAESAQIVRLKLMSQREKQMAGEAAALALPKIFKDRTSFKNIKSDYDAERHALVVVAEIRYPGFSKIPDWKINEDLAKGKKSYCKHFINSKMRHTGLTLELNFRTLKDDLTIGTILLNNTECAG